MENENKLNFLFLDLNFYLSEIEENLMGIGKWKKNGAFDSIWKDSSHTPFD